MYVWVRPSPLLASTTVPTLRCPTFPAHLLLPEVLKSAWYWAVDPDAFWHVQALSVFSALSMSRNLLCSPQYALAAHVYESIYLWQHQKGFLPHLCSPMCFPVGNILPSAASCNISTYGLDTLSDALCITDCLYDDVGIVLYTHHMILLNLIWECVEWMYSICIFMCFTSTSSDVQTIHICIHVWSSALRKDIWLKKWGQSPFIVSS